MMTDVVFNRTLVYQLNEQLPETMELAILEVSASSVSSLLGATAEWPIAAFGRRKARMEIFVARVSTTYIKELWVRFVSLPWRLINKPSSSSCFLCRFADWNKSNPSYLSGTGTDAECG
jgi:hypothetical protein